MDPILFPYLDILDGERQDGRKRGIERMKNTTIQKLIDIGIVALSLVIAFSMIQVSETRGEVCERETFQLNHSTMQTNRLTFSQIECVNQTTGKTYVKQVRPVK